MLSHGLRVMLGNKFERVHELVSVHDLNLSLDLTDHILVLVEHQNHSIDILSTFDHLISD